MKQYKVVVQALAKTDVREARVWYYQIQPNLGKRFTIDMANTLRKLASNPTAFAVRYKKIRLANFDTFPYAAHFYIDDDSDTVFVLAIMHTSRNPDTPKNR